VRKVGIITGLKSEADCLRSIVSPLNLNIQVSGVSPEAAKAHAQHLSENGCELLVSFGVAGALRHGINTGALLLPGSVKCLDGRSFETNAKIRNRLMKQAQSSLPDSAILDDPIWGANELIGTKTEKLSVGEKHKVAAIDMESHHIAFAAHANGLPFIVVRSILDDIGTELPGFVGRAITSGGTPDYAKILTEVALKPWYLNNLIGLAARNRTAHRTLSRVAPLLIGALNG
jgi:adenosylhomocysteine nucleosidase